MVLNRLALNPNDPEFDLQCWYMQEERVLSLLGARQLEGCMAAMRQASEIGEDFVRRATIEVILKGEIVAWLSSNEVETIGQQLISGSIRPGNLFTLFQDFYGRGLSYRSLESGRRKAAQVAELYAKLDTYGFPGIIHIPFSVEHLRTNTAFSRLSGHTRLFVFGYIEEIKANEIQAHAYLIADLITNSLKRPNCVFDWNMFNEVHVSMIDNFRLVNDQPRPKLSTLKLLRQVPEAEVKKAFAEIIGEPTIPKDWAGEKSDLFSTYVQINGRRISTAFAFKGPAQFKPMTMASLGKNGDQIDRLFSEPADLLVLQHCHVIETPVRSAMRAYANQINKPRMYCVIDGFDTCRLLRAYHMCGL